MKRILITIVAALWFVPALAGGLTDMSYAERDAFRQEVRAYLLDNPEVLMEAIQVLEDRQKEQQAASEQDVIAANAKEIFRDGFSYVGGNPEGDITLVEFQDYRCGYCRKAHEEVAELIRSDGNIRLVVKEFPILGEQSLLSSRLAIATLHKAGPESYKQLMDFLISFSGNLTEKSMTGILNKFDLNADEIIAYLDDDAVSGQIAAVHELAGILQISGTPTFVIGNELIRGYAPLANMREIVAYHRAAKN